MQNLHELPRLEDSISYIYLEHAVIERSDSAIIAIQETGKTPIPIATVTCLQRQEPVAPGPHVYG